MHHAVGPHGKSNVPFDASIQGLGIELFFLPMVILQSISFDGIVLSCIFQPKRQGCSNNPSPLLEAGRRAASPKFQTVAWRRILSSIQLLTVTHDGFQMLIKPNSTHFRAEILSRFADDLICLIGKAFCQGFRTHYTDYCRCLLTSDILSCDVDM